jgi:sialate O-acetylesterase
MKWLLLSIFSVCGIFSVAAEQARAKPTLFIIGDSTVRNSTPGQVGWGDPMKALFDAEKIHVENHAIGGRSSRTFISEGRWQLILGRLKPGDFVLMQFGHNDGGPFETGRARASIKGIGAETKDFVLEATGKTETVMSFGAYMRTYIQQAQAKGATPIVVSLIPRNIWKNGKMMRNDKDYALWACEVAAQTGAGYVNFNDVLAQEYEKIGQEKTKVFYVMGDHTHTSGTGARFHARILARELRALSSPKLAAFLLPAVDSLQLPPHFSDHMVMQRDVPIRLWGWSVAGDMIRARMGKSETQVSAAADGSWALELPPLSAGGPHTIRVDDGKTNLTFSDVLVGEVWLCAGQSNMDFTMAKTQNRSYAGVKNAEQEIAAANHPQLRMFAADWQMSADLQSSVGGEWKVCSPQTVGDFSAVAYFFGRQLQLQLKVPVGLITCAYGASTAEAWIPRDPLVKDRNLRPLVAAFHEKCAKFDADPAIYEKYSMAYERWQKQCNAARAAGKAVPRQPRHPDPRQDQHNPEVLYNGMIAPVQGYSIQGAIWYQGESNVDSRKLYPALQKTLIEQWRALWNCGDFPFYFVQIAPRYAPSDGTAGSKLAEMRAAQATSLQVPNTGMVVTTDCGEADDVHPRDKQTVGSRLASLALAQTYKQPGVFQGPTLRGLTARQGALELRFDHVGGGLDAHNGTLQLFTIAGNDGKFFPAEASIVAADAVLVKHPDVSEPRYVRYAWCDNPAAANLRNKEGFPAAPFRSDPAH